jgi:ribosomal protein S18 acetylase RimI-like enzyme
LKGHRGRVEFRTEDGKLIAIRDLKLSDLGAMLKFANSLVREKKTNRELGVASFERRITRKEEARFVRGLVESAGKKHGANAMAFHGGDLVGECTLIRRTPSDLRHTASLGIAVLEEYRGIGIGEALMREVLRKAKRLGVTLVELEVVAGNGPAAALYEKLGFKVVGVIPNKVFRDGKHRDIVSMYVDLRGSDKSTRSRRRKS